MKIQSLSVVVPGKCPNKCAFCVAHMQESEYENNIDRKDFYDLYRENYRQRLMFARDNGCNTIILTGDGEPLMNRRFLEMFFEMNASLPDPFRWIELQTSGVNLDNEMLRFLRNGRNCIGVSTISLSLSDCFDSKDNTNINGIPKHLAFDINKLCESIKLYGFNLRLSLNMTRFYDSDMAMTIFDRCESLGANQVTIRKLYEDGSDSEHAKWVREHKMNEDRFNYIMDYVKAIGRPLEILPFGAVRYSLKGMSIVVDDNCMAAEVTETLKYLILRQDCRLYSRWDDKGSIIF